MGQEKYVKEVLAELKDINDNIRNKKPELDSFLAAARLRMKNTDCEIIQNSTFIPAGSSYENTAVRDDADFDILMILPKPYSGVNFEAVASDVSGFFKLRWTDYSDNVSHDDEEYDEDDSEDCEDYEEYDEDDSEDCEDYEEYGEDSDEPQYYEEYDEDDSNNYQDYEEYNEDSYDYQGYEYNEDDSDESNEGDEYDANYDADDDSDLPAFVGSDGILETKELLDYIFAKFCGVLKQVKQDHPNWQLRYHPQHSTVIVNLRDSNGDILKIDIVPQIASRNWDMLPGSCRLKDLPGPLQQCVKSSHFQYPILWGLVPAPYLMNEPDGHFLVTTAFPLLEKRFLKEAGVVKDAVILVKLLSASRGWKRGFGLRPFHIKRVAMKHYNELQQLTTWKAFQRLLSLVASDLRDGMIHSFLIEDQDIYLKDYSVCIKLANQIDGAKTFVQPNNLRRCLDDDDD